MLRTSQLDQITRHLTVIVASLALHFAPQAILHAQPESDSLGRRRILPLPALASAPETGLQYGATMLVVQEPAARLATRPSSLLMYALRTTKQQTRVGAELEHWSTSNAQRVAATFVWQEFPLPYYGRGDRTPEEAREVYTPRGIEGSVAWWRRVRGPWYATGSLRHLQQAIKHDTLGVLQQLTITGSQGGKVTEITAGVLTDTRDNLFAPARGHWIQASYARSTESLWSDYSYGRVRLDARTYHTIGQGHVLAAQFQLVGVDGDAPYDQLALVGGSDIMRGYAKGRYRDRLAMAAQGEYRSPIRRRVGGVLFAGAGIARPGFGDLGQSALFPTLGAGLRVQIDARQRTAVRLDYGRGRDGASGLYIGFNQAF